MKAWRFHEFGSLRHLQYEEIPEPAPQAGEALVRLDYAALNPADMFLVIGTYPGAGQPPLVIGRDGCGVIERAAARGRFSEGREVILIPGRMGVDRDGTLAESICVPEGHLAELPPGWTRQEGAAGPLVHLTAWRTLVDECGIKPGQRVVITGASGGVGTAALVQAKAMGATVAAFSRNEEKRTSLKALGADFVFDPTEADLVAQVREALEGHGADIVVENVAGENLQRTVAMCAAGGRIGLIGLLGGIKAELDLPTILFRRIRLIGIFLGAMTIEWAQQAWEGIVALMEQAGRRPLVDSVYPPEAAREAFGRLRSGPLGKVLVGPM